VRLGDSICSFNPLYGQGMSSAALQATALGEALARCGAGDDRLPKRFYRQAAEVIANPWKIAVGADFAYPATPATSRSARTSSTAASPASSWRRGRRPR
jgi:2-polyprenyl-6-methoxyphenol hydroxylase-like FAD-dependent oxidoreductase